MRASRQALNSSPVVARCLAAAEVQLMVLVVQVSVLRHAPVAVITMRFLSGHDGGRVCWFVLRPLMLRLTPNSQQVKIEHAG